MLAIVGFVRAKAAMRRNGYSTMPSRQPMADLPKPVRKQLLRAIQRGQPVPPELQGHAERWARFVLVLARYGWAYLWLSVALLALLLNAVTGGSEVLAAMVWVLVVCLVVLVLVSLMLWQYYVAARRFLNGAAA
ncbi:hypothetical protein [Kutzneria chonburiensis]|uniref:Uncharacterized protein n=1 Tax=Kutzneria chonburiensis TaxID=1483604 RepID=A0ABV6N8J2_9PSEU|nr:hypothetical protein [Kutzneria chonburiensis]